MTTHKINPKLDLILERVVDVPVELVWAAWTKPEHIVHWFTPAPWKTIDCRIDLRPGGEFFTMMQSPEGDKFPNSGCFLEIVENKKLTWTDALQPGYRPAANIESGSNLYFTATLLLESVKGGTKYTAIGMHRNETDRQKHADMGFNDGWGKALDQLVEYMKKK